MTIKITDPKRDVTRYKGDWFYIGIHVDADNGKYITHVTLFGGSPDICRRKADRWVKKNKDYYEQIERNRKNLPEKIEETDDDYLPF